jgi:hypothetical protein
MNKIPQIDFNFWYKISNKINAERQSNKTPKINRHHAVINMIENKYTNEGIKTAYFTNFKSKKAIYSEIKRLKHLNYVELENEIIKKVNKARKNNFFKERPNANVEILQIFDLIQIWGGIPGGGGPYQSKNGAPWRASNNLNWINEYKKAAYKASTGDITAYDDFKNIKHLGGLAFASKHAYFFSKHLNQKSLIVIDEKIAHCFEIFKANEIDREIATDILSQISEAAKKSNLVRWEIEKSLFTFHSLNFRAGRRIKNSFKNKDVEIVNNLLEWYGHKANKNTYTPKKNIANSKTSVFKLTTKDKIFYTYRKNCTSIKMLRAIISIPLKKNQKWASKWFDENNLIEAIKTFDAVEDAKNYVKNIR